MSKKRFDEIERIRKQYRQYAPAPDLKIDRDGDFYMTFKRYLPDGYFWMYV